jgi:RNA polymerase sigma-70 factor (ECF subfamily)
MKDNEILSLIRSGGQHHLGLIYEKYRREFIDWISKEFNCSHDDSKDIYQVTIVAFYENVLSGKLTTLVSSLKTYLFAIGKNVARENQRRSKRSVSFDQEQWLTEHIIDENVEPDTDNTVLEAAEKALNQLSASSQKLIQLFYYEHKSMHEISTIMNFKNAETAKNQKCKSMATLRKIFRAELAQTGTMVTNHEETQKSQ